MKNDFDPLNRIPPELESVHIRLVNWANWSRDRRPQGHCRSIEYRYKSSEVWDQPEPTCEPNTLDALEVHRAVIRLPAVNRKLLLWYYCKPVDVRVVRRKLGLTLDGVVRELNKARRMVANR